MRRKHNSRINRKFYFWSILVIGTLLVLLAYARIQSPLNNAKKTTYALAKEYGNVTKIKAFYMYNRDQTYYAIYGVNDHNQNIYVLTTQDGKKVVIYAQNKGISAEQAKDIVRAQKHSKKITKVALGLYKKNPVWEVTYLNTNNNICYDLISFKTGKVIKSIQNI